MILLDTSFLIELLSEREAESHMKAYKIQEYNDERTEGHLPSVRPHCLVQIH